MGILYRQIRLMLLYRGKTVFQILFKYNTKPLELGGQKAVRVLVGTGQRHHSILQAEDIDSGV